MVISSGRARSIQRNIQQGRFVSDSQVQQLQQYEASRVQKVPQGVQVGDRFFSENAYDIIREGENIKEIRSKPQEFLKIRQKEKGPDILKRGKFSEKILFFEDNKLIKEVEQQIYKLRSNKFEVVREPFERKVILYTPKAIKTKYFKDIDGTTKLDRVVEETSTGQLILSKGPFREAQAESRQRRRAELSGRTLREQKLIESGKFTDVQISRAKVLTPEAQQKEFGGVLFETKPILRPDQLKLAKSLTEQEQFSRFGRLVTEKVKVKKQFEIGQEIIPRIGVQEKIKVVTRLSPDLVSTFFNEKTGELKGLKNINTETKSIETKPIKNETFFTKLEDSFLESKFVKSPITKDIIGGLKFTFIEPFTLPSKITKTISPEIEGTKSFTKFSERTGIKTILTQEPTEAQLKKEAISFGKEIGFEELKDGGFRIKKDNTIRVIKQDIPPLTEKQKDIVIERVLKKQKEKSLIGVGTLKLDNADKFVSKYTTKPVFNVLESKGGKITKSVLFPQIKLSDKIFEGTRIKEFDFGIREGIKTTIRNKPVTLGLVAGAGFVSGSALQSGAFSNVLSGTSLKSISILSGITFAGITTFKVATTEGGAREKGKTLGKDLTFASIFVGGSIAGQKVTIKAQRKLSIRRLNKDINKILKSRSTGKPFDSRVDIFKPTGKETIKISKQGRITKIIEVKAVKRGITTTGRQGEVLKIRQLQLTDKNFDILSKYKTPSISKKRIDISLEKDLTKFGFKSRFGKQEGPFFIRDKISSKGGLQPFGAKPKLKDYVIIKDTSKQLTLKDFIKPTKTKFVEPRFDRLLEYKPTKTKLNIKFKGFKGKKGQITFSQINKPTTLDKFETFDSGRSTLKLPKPSIKPIISKIPIDSRDIAITPINLFRREKSRAITPIALTRNLNLNLFAFDIFQDRGRINIREPTLRQPTRPIQEFDYPIGKTPPPSFFPKPTKPEIPEEIIDDNLFFPSKLTLFPKIIQGRTKRKKKKFKRTSRFQPSLVAVAFGLQQKGRRPIPTGFGIRRVPSSRKLLRGK